MGEVVICVLPKPFISTAARHCAPCAKLILNTAFIRSRSWVSRSQMGKKWFSKGAKSTERTREGKLQAIAERPWFSC